MCKITKPKSFMKVYREYLRISKLKGFKKPTLNPDLISKYGTKLTEQIEQFENHQKKFQSCNLHHRINLRAMSAPSRRLHLTKVWRYFSA